MPGMTRHDILIQLQSIASETFGCAPTQFQEATVAADIEKWDSLRHLIFISAIEQTFNVEFDIDDISGLTNVAGLVTVIAAQTA